MRCSSFYGAGGTVIMLWRMDGGGHKVTKPVLHVNKPVSLPGMQAIHT